MGKLRSIQEREESFKKMTESVRTASKAIDIKVSRPPDAQGSKSLEEALAYAEQKENLSPVSEKVLISLSRIQDSPYQPRLAYPDIEIKELSISLEKIGQQEPIRVRASKNEGYFELLDGHRRIRAARLIGLEVLEASVENKTDSEAHITIATSIETRKGLSEWERAKMYQSLLAANRAKNNLALADLLGCSRARVTQVLTAIKLPDEIQSLFESHTSKVTRRVVQTAAELLEEFPYQVQLIVQAIERVFVEGAPTQSIKLWVKQQLSRSKQASLPRRDTSLIVNKAGHAIFSVKSKLNGEVVASLSKGVSISHEHLQNLIVAALRAHVDSVATEENILTAEEDVSQTAISDEK